MCYVTAIILLVLFAFKATSLQFDHGNLKITHTVLRFFIVIDDSQFSFSANLKKKNLEEICSSGYRIATSYTNEKTFG